MPDLQSRSLLDLTAHEVAAALNAGFEGYLVPMRFTPGALERRVRPEHLDAEASRVYTLNGQTAGAALVARRGWTCRVAAMGVAAPVRGQGVGRAMLAEVLDAARARGDRAVTLEAVETNAPALRLYTSAGFAVVRRLVGYDRAPEPGEAAPITELDPAELARRVARHGEPGLPWMLDAPTLAAQVAPVRAWTLDGAALLASDPVNGVSTLHALVTRPEARGRGQMRRLLRAFVQRHGGCGLRLIPVVPEGLAPGFFAACGFTPGTLAQVEMRADLA